MTSPHSNGEAVDWERWNPVTEPTLNGTTICSQRAPNGSRFVQDIEVDSGWLPETAWVGVSRADAEP